MAFVTRKVLLTGCRAGQTCIVNHGRFHFTDGALVLRGEGEYVASLMKILADTYQAYEVGDPRLEAAQNGEHNLQAPGEQPNPEPPILGGDEPVEPGAAEGEAHHGSGSDGTDQGRPLPDGRERGPRDAHRDGQEDPRLQRIKVALDQLDPGTDAHWTVEGLPKVKVIAALAKIDNVTRRDIDKAAPGFNR